MNEQEFIATVAAKVLTRLDDDAATLTMMMGNVGFCAGPYETCPVPKPAEMSVSRYDSLWSEMKDAGRTQLEKLSKRLRSTSIMKTQLTQALQAKDALEVAILAGLLTREGSLKRLRCGSGWGYWRKQAAAILADIEVDHLADRLATTTTLDPAAIDALFGLDELCAAAWWAGAESAPLTDAITLVTSMVRAFPEPWGVLSPDASDQMAFLPLDDPSRPLWRTIEAAQWEME